MGRWELGIELRIKNDELKIESQKKGKLKMRSWELRIEIKNKVFEIKKPPRLLEVFPIKVAATRRQKFGALFQEFRNFTDEKLPVPAVYLDFYGGKRE